MGGLEYRTCANCGEYRDLEFSPLYGIYLCPACAGLVSMCFDHHHKEA